jgi:cardiolipin synthase
MITDFGKFIDPVADKATQIVVIGCLVTRFPLMLLPCIVLLVKELGSLALRVVVYQKTDVIRGAHWHGKAATCFVVITILLHLVWSSITPVVSNSIIIFCTVFLLFSGTMYTIEAFQIMKNEKKA